jgi:hypothetical protein
VQVRRFEILVLGRRPVAHLTMLWYVVARGVGMVSLPVHQAGEAQSIFGRITVRVRCQAMWTSMLLPWYWRKRSMPSAEFP